MSEAAWEHVRFGDPEAWVRPDAYEASVPAKEGAHTTFLLWSRQVHVDSGTTFNASALRLETALAVQNESQWKLNFNPRYQDATLHWLRLVRGGERIDHRHKERMRLLQRETKLEHHVIDGSWTLVVVLDDVRPGDVIESAFSLTTRHPITEGRCEVFYYVPSHVVAAVHRLQVLFSSDRPAMQWQASADAPPREESLEGGLTRWQWSGAQLAASVRTPEPQCPANYLDYLWVQVSDWSGWTHLAGRVAATWRNTLENGGGDLPAFPRPERVDQAAVAGLVRRLQDDFRYLSVDLTAGGWIPSSPAAVAARRHGDCKDLAWLAVTVLRAWGVPARPILVGSRLRETAGTLLPMSALFDHAVVEVEVEGEARWFDLTLRLQGGDYRSRPVLRFGAGLPVEEGASLRVQPGPVASGLHAVNETFHLDERPGAATEVEQAHRLEGWQAENTRRLREAHGAEAFANHQLQLAQKRYGKAKRIGELQWRDNRDANVVEWVERFELHDVVALLPDKRAAFVFPRSAVWEALVLPDDKPRRTPWALPLGAEFRHQIRAVYGGLPSRGVQRARWDTDEMLTTIDHALERACWAKTSRLVFKAASVPPGKVAAHRLVVADVARRGSLQITFRRKAKHIPPDAAFGSLPPATATRDDLVPVGPPADYPEATLGRDWRGPARRVLLGRWLRFGISTLLFIILIVLSETMPTCHHG